MQCNYTSASKGSIFFHLPKLKFALFVTAVSLRRPLRTQGEAKRFPAPFSFCFAGPEAELAMLSGSSVTSKGTQRMRRGKTLSCFKVSIPIAHYLLTA